MPQRSLFLAFCLFLATTFPTGTAQAAECSRTYIPGMVPLSDLGTGTYQGQVGGLYQGGSNQIPTDHLNLGLSLATEITPRSSTGTESSSGQIVFISIGVSNTSGEFQSFIRIADPLRASSVVVVNGAQSGEPINSWLDPNARPWGVVAERLAAAGVTSSQVQAVWVKLPEKDPTEPFPVDATTYAADLATVIRNVKTNFPNVRLAYISSRIYAGYGTELNPEPWAYQNGFGSKFTIDSQIAGDLSLNADSSRGSVVAPWIGWGPYLWANGAGPDGVAGGAPGRSDGLEWLCSDFRDDGIHPSDEGAAKVATMLLSHLHSDPTACQWYLADPSTCGVGLPPSTFGDIAGSQFQDDILWLAEQGITNGCSASPPLFCPHEVVTRGQMAAFLVRALDLPAGPDLFTDDESSIFEADINSVATAGITTGCSTSPPMFCPEEPVTREQMAAFLVRALDLAAGPDLFVDDESSIFEPDINSLAQAGITNGCSTSPPMFCPEDPVTREQMAAFLHRALPS
ncbi:MAG: S-layer homology domain-containing protein [Acidimicrobiia bacterium]